MGRDISEYINNIAVTDVQSDIMTVEHRSNNSKRDYLFCNKKQGKHIPVSPSRAFDMFDALVEQIQTYGKINTKHGIVVVGFAETATAIGAYVAKALDKCVYQLQTTREECAGKRRLIEFSEEHSHATAQYLYGDLSNMPDFDYILFVEDEISTGKTIINFINEFNKVKQGLKFGVASICNWQNDVDQEKYKSMGIDTFALIRGQLKDVNAKMEVEVGGEVVEGEYDVTSSTNSNEYELATITLGDGVDPFILNRTGRDTSDSEYLDALEQTIELTEKFIGTGQDILILGTEEFMYFPMLVGEMLESFGKQVKTHATTRSSIDIIKGSKDISNEIVNKSLLRSAYEEGRNTYIYNLRTYEKVIIITDSKLDMTSSVSRERKRKTFRSDIVHALVSHGNKESDILFIELK